MFIRSCAESLLRTTFFLPAVGMMFPENPFFISVLFFFVKPDILVHFPPPHATRPYLCLPMQNWKGSDFSAQFYSATERRTWNKRGGKKSKNTRYVTHPVSH